MGRQQEQDVEPFLAACSLHKRPVNADLLTRYLRSIQVVNRRLSLFERIVLYQRITLTQTTSTVVYYRLTDAITV